MLVRCASGAILSPPKLWEASQIKPSNSYTPPITRQLISVGRALFRHTADYGYLRPQKVVINPMTFTPGVV